MEEAKGILDESAWIVAFHHLAIINTKGRTNPLFCGLLLTLEWKKSKRNKEINKVVDFVWTSGCGLQRTSQLHKKL